MGVPEDKEEEGHPMWSGSIFLIYHSGSHSIWRDSQHQADLSISLLGNHVTQDSGGVSPPLLSLGTHGECRLMGHLSLSSRCRDSHLVDQKELEESLRGISPPSKCSSPSQVTQKQKRHDSLFLQLPQLQSVSQGLSHPVGSRGESPMVRD